LRVCTDVVEVPVWTLPLPELPGGERPRLELVAVPAGWYPIGSTEAEPGREEMMGWYAANRIGCEGVDVEARRTVRLQPLALARHPITRDQWRAVARLPREERDLNVTPSTRKPDGLWESHAQPGALPVDSVSWHDVQEWLRRLNAWLEHQWPEWSKTWPSQTAGTSGAPRLALPSESQWEAACRAGASTPFHFGDTLDANWANFDGGYVYGPGRQGVYRQSTVPVGFFGLVNRWGLADMHGQVFEWCADQWHPDPAAEGWPSDGTAWEGVDPALEAKGTAQKDWKLLRGGSWLGDPHDCRAALRNGILPANVNSSVGCRPCCLLPPGFLLGP
jgi:formylglycine-generating enzyme required for sulfatase activity